jgi:hypothetical protein
VTLLLVASEFRYMVLICEVSNTETALSQNIWEQLLVQPHRVSDRNLGTRKTTDTGTT